MAASLKANGNSAYSQRKFTEAVDFYTRAIGVSPKPEAVFYSNRAACTCHLLLICFVLHQINRLCQHVPSKTRPRCPGLR